MSGPGEDRWRGGRPFENRQPTQRNSGLGSRDRTGGSQGGGSRGGQSNSWAGPRGQAAPSPTQEQHIPVNEFNAAECKTALERVPTQPAPIKYRPSGLPAKDVATNRASGPWGVKPNSMASGKDFFLELRKQVGALQNGSSISGG
ncbi:hypothetical protein BGW36DRAFT_374950 [Talaromyces proteolyticus]|uniref:Uncharacterized protein n=1 Tax=Talaromyces proteolyticus TaxID=1131652 RepID=A0AAD4KZ75_9EURO|nr:uncharacterized protein BGW36DRAFT_374950 [Talaromyces proteolyticus]KAH8700781.1 hypothetical protein BGW36DRAFT_374950 [Talaromyces proteolyticus]